MATNRSDFNVATVITELRGVSGRVRFRCDTLTVLHLRWHYVRNCGLVRDIEELERLLQEHTVRLLIHGQQ